PMARWKHGPARYLRLPPARYFCIGQPVFASGARTPSLSRPCFRLLRGCSLWLRCSGYFISRRFLLLRERDCSACPPSSLFFSLLRRRSGTLLTGRLSFGSA